MYLINWCDRRRLSTSNSLGRNWHIRREVGCSRLKSNLLCTSKMKYIPVIVRSYILLGIERESSIDRSIKPSYWGKKDSNITVCWTAQWLGPVSFVTQFVKFIHSINGNRRGRRSHNNRRTGQFPSLCPLNAITYAHFLCPADPTTNTRICPLYVLMFIVRQNKYYSCSKILNSSRDGLV